ncbi:MAG: hypothetical protein GY927_08535 [bacterium]|nr:hypothetical protein [bacterium]
MLRASSREGGLGGPSSVGAQLSEDRSRRLDTSRNPSPDAVFQSLEDSLATLKAETGLQLGFDYQATWQLSHDNTLGTLQASSGKARILGKWDLINRAVSFICMICCVRVLHRTFQMTWMISLITRLSSTRGLAWGCGK